MRGEVKISFNEDWVKSVSKTRFLDSQAHLKDVVNLSDAYDKIVGVKETKRRNGNNTSTAEESPESES